MNLTEAEKVMAEADLLVGEAEVEKAITRMAADISARLAGTEPVVLCIMNGGLIFSGQLLTRLRFPLEVDYVHATRYGQESRGCDLNWLAKPKTGLKGRTVLLLDDILDEGITLACIVGHCLQQGAARVFTAVLIDKQHDRKCSDLPKADFTGLEVENRFLFGYGMDYKGYWRNAAGIYAAKGM